MTAHRPVLQARGIRKDYPGTVALDDVDFDLLPGEIHALMGENGAGKSTLIKILTGAEQSDEGRTLLEGNAVDFPDTSVAQKAGVWAVHQEVTLLPNLSVAENLLLGFQPTRFGLVQRSEMKKLAQATLLDLGLDLDVERPLGGYPVAVRQLVAIARAVRTDARVLVLDEPTASLDASEVERLFALIRQLAERGTAIIFISHFLDQVYAISDRITVLRNGQRVGTYFSSALPKVELVSAMLGKGLEDAVEHPPSGSAQERPVTACFTRFGKENLVEPFDLDLHAGEAIGAAGLLGSGRTETALLMFGVLKTDSGSVLMDGQPVRLNSPSDAIRLGFAFSPEDRKTDGIIGAMSVRDNITIALQARNGWYRKLPRREQDRIADTFISALNIRTPDADKPIEQLSGGNQQKALLARWLATEPRLLILDEPTRGIDVGAHAEIVRLIEKLRDEGMSLYVISSELEELTAYSDRISVMRDRKQVCILEGSDVAINAIVSAIAAPETAE
ncbi:MAG TPA: sugar ABC transporter ATP-binding protein [Sphingomicrobium sp.]|nr:sugar ABC transporter ATP-binding protein [Sphingomicrobium sp.]